MTILANILLALPCLWGLKNWLGWRHMIILFCCLGIFAWSFEAMAVLTGWPYGSFVYGDALAGKLFNLVPWTVPFAWVPLVCGSAWMVHRYIPAQKIWGTVVFTSLLTTLIDTVLDPAATAFGFWHWQQNGWWYGVPLQNFFGWFVSAALGSLILEKAVRRKSWQTAPCSVAVSAVASLALWTGACVVLQFWWAAAIGSILIVAFWYEWKSQRHL